MFMDLVIYFFLILTFIIQIYGILTKKRSGNQYKRFLISSSVMSLILLFVLAIRIHHLLRSNFNISNSITYAVSIIPFMVYFITFRKYLLNNYSGILLISILSMSISIILDLVSDGRLFIIPYYNLIEDILLVISIFFWFLFYFYSILKMKDN